MTAKRQRLALTRATYLAAFESSLDAFYLMRSEHDEGGRIADFIFSDLNRRGTLVLRMPKEEIIGRRLCELVPISSTGDLFKTYLKVAETGEPSDGEFELKMAEIDARWIRQQVVRTPDGIAITARNITTRKLAEIANRKSQAFLQSLIDYLPLLVYVKSARARNFGELSIWNKAAENITGYTREQVVGVTSNAAFRGLSEVAERIDDEVLNQVLPVEFDFSFRRRDDSDRDLHSLSVALFDEYNKPEYILSIAEDVTEHKAAVEQLQLAAAVFEHATEAIAVSDAHDRIITINRAFCQLTGFSKEELIGELAADFEPSDGETPDAAEMIKQVTEQGVWTGEGRQLRKNGEAFQCSRNVVCVKDEHGRVSKYIRIATDITALKDSQAQLEQAANHDPLTGLPNRRLFADRLAHALEGAQRSKQNVALLFVDLDAFKSVNDTFGHEAGDLLLKEIAIRLSGCARGSDTVCRIGGDEFMIVMENSGHLIEPGLLGQRIVDAFRLPFLLDKDSVATTASIGVSVYPLDGTKSDVLMRSADAAMYRAKQLGGGRYQFFSDTQKGKTTARPSAEHELHAAIEQQQFFLVYQPMVNMTTGITHGLEALVRWNHADGTRLPEDFIRLAEVGGLIAQLGEWVLRRVCSDMQHWREMGLADFSVAVNVSAGQFQRGNLLSTVERALRDYQIEPGRLELEITETAMLEKTDAAQTMVAQLKSTGVSISVDDFGTGYSSLTLLRRLAANSLKIDRTFIHDIPDDEHKVTTVQAILLMARALNMRVVAEGVETRSQFQLLKDLRCDQAQGYFLSRPVLSSYIPALLRERQFAAAVQT